MTKVQATKQYDLEACTQKFAKDIIAFIKGRPKTIVNVELVKQLVRSSTSFGVNYIEANEALSKKDFFNESDDQSKRGAIKHSLVEIGQTKRS